MLQCHIYIYCSMYTYTCAGFHIGFFSLEGGISSVKIEVLFCLFAKKQIKLNIRDEF